MISRINKIIHCLLILILILINAGCSNNSKKTESNELEELRIALQELQLNIAVVVSNKETSTRLAFIAKNNSKIDIPVPEFWYYPNSLEVLEPNAKRPRSLSGDSMIREVVIKPSESKIWYLDTMELFELYKKEGLYHIKWKIYEAESPEILLSKERENNDNQVNNYEDKKSDLSKELEDLELNIAIMVFDKKSSPELAFIAKNKGKNDITIPEFCYTANRIEILKPNSQRPISFSASNSMDVVIKPSESKIWYMSIVEFFEVYKEEGLYSIKWKIYDEESPEEILLLREKDKIEN